VDWPAGAFSDAAAPIIICVLGKDPFEGSLEETLKDRTVGGAGMGDSITGAGVALNVRF